MSNNRDNNNRSCIGRLINNYVKGLNEFKELPKLVVMVIDDDSIKFIKNDSDETVETQIKMITDWLVNEMEKATKCCTEHYPSKAKRDGFPHILWIAPPSHKNFGKSNNKRREAQTYFLYNSVKQKKDMTVLKMIKFWDYEDPNTFLYDSYRFTSEGLLKYWQAIDSAIRFWSVVIAPKLQPFPGKFKAKINMGRQGGPNKFKWNNNSNYKRQKHAPYKHFRSEY